MQDTSRQNPACPVSPRAAFALIRESINSWIDDYAPSMGAALAYYTVFSIAPLLMIVITVAGVIFGAEAARGEVVSELNGLIGAEGAEVVEGMLVAVSEPAASTITAIFGVVALLVGATTVFAELQSSRHCGTACGNWRRRRWCLLRGGASFRRYPRPDQVRRELRRSLPAPDALRRCIAGLAPHQMASTGVVSPNTTTRLRPSRLAR